MSKEGIVARTPIEPAGDTRPIAQKDLLDDQKQVLKALCDRIDGFCERVAATRHERDKQARLKQRSSAPWRPIDDDRPNQVLMLDGRRGTGKTSLLLTALKTWRDSRAHTDGMRVIALDPVDFDPMPAGLSPFAWVVLTLRRLVDWLDDGCAPATAPYLWDDDSDETKPTLDALWQAFFRRAEIGWSKPARQDDIEDFIQHSREKQKGWLKLQDAWERLIDGLFDAAERQRKVSQDSVIVLPIDDLDLAPRRAREVLLTLRQLYHERVVFLLTGDVTHLQSALELRQFGAEWVKDAPHDEREETWKRVRGLTVDLVNKVIPPPHRLRVKALGPLDALKLVARRAGFMTGTEPDTSEYLINALSNGSTDDDVRARYRKQASRIERDFKDSHDNQMRKFAAFRVRELMQAIESPFGGPQDQFYRVVTSARPVDDSRLVDLRGMRNGTLRVISTKRGRPSGSDRTRTRAYRFRVWDDAAKRPRPLNLIEQTILRGQLQPLMIHAWNQTDWRSPLAHTNLRLASTTCQIPWPGVPIANLTDAEDKAQLLSYYDSTSDLFRAWLSAHLVWSGVETDVDRSLPLTELLERVVLAADASPWVRSWLTEKLPALCAPEHGLADDLCYGVFQAVARLAVRNDDWQSWTQAWTQARMAMLAAFRDGEPDANELAGLIDRKYPRHAWHNRNAFGPTGTWLDFKGTSNLRLGNAVYAHHPPGMHGPSLSETLLLTRFAQNERSQHWATSEVTRFLVSSGNIRRFAEAVEALERSFGRKWAAKYLVGIWEELVAQTPEVSPDIAGWFRSSKTGDGISNRGPQELKLAPRWIEFRGRYSGVPDGWQASEPLPQHLVAWLCILQAYASRMPKPMQGITVPRISAGDAFPAWPEMDWLTAEYALKMFEAAQTKFSEAPEAEDVLHDAHLMNWLACATEAMSLGSIYQGVRVDLPVSVQDIESFLENVFGDRNSSLPAEKKPELKAWLRELRSSVEFKTSELRDAWLDWWRKQDERVMTDALAKLSKMPENELLGIVGDSSVAHVLRDHVLGGGTFESFEDLAEIKHVGPKSIAKLKAWAESLA